jgi:hypothetical protein
MPSHGGYVVRAGSTSARFLVYAQARGEDGGARVGQAGLRYDAPGAAAAYVREGEPARGIALRPGRPEGWSAGGFAEVDPDRVPGYYWFDVPDQVLARGASHALLLLRFAGAVMDPVEVALVGYDPGDSQRLGMGSLDPIEHGRFLRRGMPGLARLELAMWDEADRLGDRSRRDIG